MSCGGCGVNSNYAPVKVYINGIKCNPYTFTLGGVVYANGQKYVGVNDGQSESPAFTGYPASVNIPKCCNSQL